MTPDVTRRRRETVVQLASLAVLVFAAGCIDLFPVSLFDTGGEGAGQPVPGSGFFDASVVNDSSSHADVTLRFFLVDTIVHETVLRHIAPGTTTIIAGPEVATHLIASGTDDTGRDLSEERFAHEGGTDDRTLAVYVITDPAPSPPLPPVEPPNPPANVDTTGPPVDIDTTGPTDIDTGGVEDVDTSGANGGGGGGGGGGDGPSITDCNGNGVDDMQDIAAETSYDINGNGQPDECEPDCNTNGMPDDYELASGEGNDCDSNGVLDDCDLVAGSANDCNSNGSLDDCEIAAGSAEDCNTNGVLDDCEDFVCGPPEACCLPGGCLNLRPDQCLARGGESLGAETDCNYDECPQACCFDDGSCSDVSEYACWNDLGEPQGDGSTCETAQCPQPEACCTSDGCFDTLPENCVGTQMFPLGPGTTCQLDECPQACCHADASCTDVVSGVCEVDGVAQGAGSTCATAYCSVDCQLNGIPDSDELVENDCNGNLVPDECDIAGATSTDINTNGVPDDCELRSLDGWWRFDFVSSTGLLRGVTVCDYYAEFATGVRYMRFSAEDELVESWAPFVSLQQYLQFTYPSTNGPSYKEFYYLGTITNQTARTAQTQIVLGTLPVFLLQETVTSLPNTFAETGNSTIEGVIDASFESMVGTWQFVTATKTLCGRFTAVRIASPPPLL